MTGPRKLLLYTSILTVLLALSLYASLVIGPAPATGLVYEYRLYRALEASLAGFILGAAGALLQSSLRNPLVDHYVLGIGSGALFTAYISVLAASTASLIIVPASAIVGGLLALSLTLIVAERIGGSDVAYVLSGMGVNSLFSGASILLSYMILTTQPYALALLAGSFVMASPRYLPHLLVAAAVVSSAYPPLAKPLNALMIGDEYAGQLGYDYRSVRRASIVIAGIASSIVVSLFGIIGFLGLVSPHIARLLAKTSDNRLVILLAGLVGSIILLLTDDLSRTILVSVAGEIPAGAIASLIGAPFFIVLLIGRFRGGLY